MYGRGGVTRSLSSYPTKYFTRLRPHFRNPNSAEKHPCFTGANVILASQLRSSAYFCWRKSGNFSFPFTLFISKITESLRGSCTCRKAKMNKIKRRRERRWISKLSSRVPARKQMKCREISAKGCFSCHSPNAWDYLATTRPRYRRRCCNPAMSVVSRMVRRWFDCNIVKKRKDCSTRNDIVSCLFKI